MTDYQDLLRRLRATGLNRYTDALEAEAASALEALLKEREELRSGEYICRKCGLRKDCEHAKADF